MQLKHRLSDDGGFTLVELLMVVVILGVIAVPLANALIGVLRNTDATSDRLALSHDAQITAAYFGRDTATVGVHDYTAASAPFPFKQSVQLNAAYNAGGYTCGSSGTAILRLLSDDWVNPGDSAPQHVDIVAYYLNGSELHRMKCTASSTPDSDVVLAHYVDPATPAVTCSSDCQSASVPQQIALTFTVKKGSANPYPIAVNGQRRQS